MGGKIELTCDYCGNTFSRYKSNIRESKRIYCSKECMKNDRVAEKEKRICKTCGKEFSVYKSVIEKTNASGNFCCRKCYAEYLATLTGEKNRSYNREKVQCKTCGKIILRTPSKLNMYKNAFCSVECRGAYMKNYIGGENNCNWKGGASKYRGDFDDVKRKHFPGVQFCAVCGTTKGIHIHHIIPYRLTQDNSKSNLIPLCRKHHKIVEASTLRFIELFDNGGYGTAKRYLNYVLRERQFETYSVLNRIAEKVKENASGIPAY